MIVNYTVEDILPKSQALIPKKLELSFLHTKQEIKKSLSSTLSEIHISADVWTSPNKKAFLAIVAYFINKEGKLWKVLLGLLQLRESYGSQHQAEYINNIID